jgi:hypothetical protein
VKCIYDQDRKAFYVVPISVADRTIITDVFDMQLAGDFVLLVRQDVPSSDNVLSHLEVSRFMYSPPRAFSVYEFARLAADPSSGEGDRALLGTKRATLANYILRRQAVANFIAGLVPATLGNVVVIPPGTTPIDPED